MSGESATKAAAPSKAVSAPDAVDSRISEEARQAGHAILAAAATAQTKWKKIALHPANQLQGAATEEEQTEFAEMLAAAMVPQCPADTTLAALGYLSSSLGCVAEYDRFLTALRGRGALLFAGKSGVARLVSPEAYRAAEKNDARIAARHISRQDRHKANTQLRGSSRRSGGSSTRRGGSRGSRPRRNRDEGEIISRKSRLSLLSNLKAERGVRPKQEPKPKPKYTSAGALTSACASTSAGAPVGAPAPAPATLKKKSWVDIVEDRSKVGAADSGSADSGSADSAESPSAEQAESGSESAPLTPSWEELVGGCNQKKSWADLDEEGFGLQSAEV